MAQTARDEAERTTNAASERMAGLARHGGDAAREVAGRGEELAHGGMEAMQKMSNATAEIERAVMRRSSEGVAEFSQAAADLFKQQAQHNSDALKSLTQTVDWNQVAKIQGELLRSSMERYAQFIQRYMAISEAVMSTAASAIKDQSRKAA